jgi:hypothetical protein
MSSFEELVASLHADPQRYGATPVPHPRAAGLFLPDRSPAPDALRTWATFDERFPGPLSRRRSDVVIADAKGKVLALPMKKVLREVCLESIRDELEGDDETIAYLKGLITDFVEKFPGYGVMLDPDETPDRVLWLTPSSATVIWYEHDSFARREPFEEWVTGLFTS